MMINFKKWNSWKIVLGILVLVILLLGIIAPVQKANAAMVRLIFDQKTYQDSDMTKGFIEAPDSNTQEQNFALINQARVAAGLTPYNSDTPSLQAANNQNLGQNPNTPINNTVMGTGTLLYAIVSVVALIITFVGYLMNLALNFGNSVINLNIVQTGSGIVLGFANLGFVFAIIIMAFATIFRVQSYAMKQTLWKLIVAALLVNFSLTIAGAVISVSNSFTGYFQQSTGYSNLADGLAGVLNPQSVIEVAGKNNPAWYKIFTNFFDYFIKYILSLAMVLVLSFIILLTFFALSIMFLIRAIYLGILLILMPIIWLLWIFPATQKHWQKWWQEFIRWNFFAPVVLFFISLVIKTGQQMSQAGGQLNNLVKNKVDTATFQQALGNASFVNENFLQYAAQEIIITGLLIGGLFAANSMGIAFAGIAYGWAQKAGKGVSNWTSRKGLQFGTGMFLRNKTAEPDSKSRAERIQSWAERQTGLGRYAAGWINQGVAKITSMGGEDLVKKEKDRIKNMSLGQKKAALVTASSPREIALLEDFAANGNLDSIDEKRYNTEKYKDKFARFSHSKQFGDVEKGFGASVEMLDAALKGDLDALAKAADKFAKKLKMADVGKMPWNDIFATKPAFGLDGKTAKDIANNLSYALAENLPGAFAKIGPKTSGQNIGNYVDIADKQIRVLEAASPEKGAIARNSFKKNLGALRVGLTEEPKEEKEEKT